MGLTPLQLQDKLPADIHSPLPQTDHSHTFCMGHEWFLLAALHSPCPSLYMPVGCLMLQTAEQRPLPRVQHRAGKKFPQIFQSSEQISMHLIFHVKTRLWVVATCPRGASRGGRAQAVGEQQAHAPAEAPVLTCEGFPPLKKPKRRCRTCYVKEP